MKKNAGFTLIELVAVMLILAILAVIAVPQFVDLRADARAAATQGVAGALASGAALNYARRSVNPANGVAVDNCTDVAATLQGGVMPTEGGVAYTIVDREITAAEITAGTVVNCTVQHPADSTVTATFPAIGMN